MNEQEFTEIRVTHSLFKVGEEIHGENIFINGEYWGQRTPDRGSWFVVTSPPALTHEGEVEDMIENSTTFAVTISRSDYDLTIRQLYILTQGIRAPF